jgi:hypothetical protein
MATDKDTIPKKISWAMKELNLRTLACYASRRLDQMIVNGHGCYFLTKL